ncbi:putative C-_U-editing enzyme APOBEC-2 [Oryzias melastigma]|uniref:Apolipoprotein B mRNA editing enzyme, catalytic polypeptide-like 2a n=1 Tax=Oryzias melastigma TaxID=30732 RepID=A0A3B3B5Z4_ORYME|nr:C->U-editing enzyme APOBEC-2a [Oryzias melastigma]KAF6718273.1 putative C->U-editing enzyme APOBEC-2 [Oryzias melastigma]
MADKKRTPPKRKERTEEVRDDGQKPEENGEVPSDSAAAAAVENSENGTLQYEPMELPPFEVITGDRIDPFVFKFQFKNVEYSSGRNKTLLCYLVDSGGSGDGLLRGYLEDEHAGTHAEEAFFTHCLPNIDPSVQYNITWYVSSSPCQACSLKLAELLKSRKNVKLSIFSSRLFEWEAEEVQAGLKALHSVGCKLRVMKPLDFSYTWDTFVETEEEPLNLWEDCKDNYEYYHEKLDQILH